MEAPEASEKRLKTLDTTEHLQSFLEALKEINKISLRHRSNLYKVLEGYEDPDLVLLQYFKLLAATYDRKGTSRGFCSIICSLMLKWTSKEAQQSLDEDELLKTMLEGWNMNGGVSLIPDDLLNALQPEFKTAFFFAADTIIGRSASKTLAVVQKAASMIAI